MRSMGRFRIEEYYVRDDGRRESLGSYEIADTERDKLWALLQVLSAEALRAGGYANLAVYLDETPVDVFVDAHDHVRVRPFEGTSALRAHRSPAGVVEDSAHVLAIHEYYLHSDGTRETFGIYRVPASERKKAAEILEVASARTLRAGGYGGVAIYLDGQAVNARVDENGELQFKPAKKAPKPPANTARRAPGQNGDGGAPTRL